MSIISRLRRTHPYLTPGFNPESEDDLEPLRRLIQSPPILRRLTTPEPPHPETNLPVGEPNVPVLTRQPVVPTNPEPVSPLLESLRREIPPVEVGSAPPMVIRRDGRPTNKFIGDGDPLERAEVRRRALSEYEPKKESKKHLVLRTLLNFVGGGIPGAAQTLIGPGGVMDRRALDRNWQQNELAKENESIQGLRLDRRAGMQDRLLESQVLENQAQAQRALREPAAPSLVDYGGYQIPQTEAARLAQARALAEGKPVAKRRYTIGNQIVEEQPDGSLKPVFTGADKPQEDVEFANRSVQQNISDAEGEKAKIEKRMSEIPITIQGVNAYGEPTTQPNPEYVEHKNRRDSLIDQIRKWRADIKAPKLTRSTPQVVKPARDGKFHYTPEQIRASLQPGQSYEEIYAKLKANPKVVIQE